MPQFDKIVLEQIMFASIRTFDPSEMPVSTPELVTWWEPRLREMAVSVKWLIMGKRYDPIVIEYPADWWQAFKARWFVGSIGRWWLLKHPVKMITHKIIVEDIFPKIPLPNGRRYCEVAVIKPSDPFSYYEPPFKPETK